MGTYHSGTRPLRGRSNVWNYDGIFTLLQARLGLWLVLEHVQATPEIWIILQVFHQSDFINDRTPGCIDEQGVLLHQRKPVLVDEVLGVLVQVAVQADDLHHIRLHSYPDVS